MPRALLVVVLVGACTAQPLDLSERAAAGADLAAPSDGGAAADLEAPDLLGPPDLAKRTRCGTPQSFAAGTNPYAIAAGDLDRDGKLDLVVGDFDPNNKSPLGVNVLFGRGDGTLAPPISYAAGSAYIESVVIDDIDRDGSLDVIVADHGSQPQVTIFFGDGSGALVGGSNVTIASLVGLAPDTVITADFNSDGKPDLATANSSQVGQDTSVVLNQGSRAFATPHVYNAGFVSSSIIAGDFNRDGKLDLIRNDPFPAGSPSPPGRLALLLGHGDGTFATPSYVTLGTRDVWLTSADLNNDGKLDLVSANFDGGSVSLLRGNGDGSFAAATTLGAQPQVAFVASADWNRDGRLDLLVAGADGVTLLLGKGDGTFADAVQCPIGSTRQLATGDFDGDGRLDIVTTNPDANMINVLLNPG
jgi:hypothetical protein